MDDPEDGSLHLAVTIMLAAALLNSPPAATAQTQRSGCTPDRCEIVLSRLMTGSDERQELHGAYGTAPIFVARDARGRFLTAVRHGVAVFDSSGRFLVRLGRPGAGPGEFTVPYPPLVGRGDSVHVFDVAQRRLTVFTPDLNVARIVAGFPLPGEFLLGDGSYVAARQLRTRDRIGLPLHLISAKGDVLSSFGSDTAQFRADLPLLMNRVVGAGKDGTVWAAAPGRYVIERWHAGTGRLLDRISVRPQWFQESVRYPGTWNERPVTTIEGLWEDDQGLLWVLMHTADRNWRPPNRSGEFAPTPRETADRLDSIVDVIDPVTKKVLATRRFSDPLYLHPQSKLLTSHQTADPYVVAFDVWTAHLQVKERPR